MPLEEALLVERIGPPDAERHERGVVDPGLGDPLELAQLGGRRESQLEVRRADAQAGQRVRRAQEQVPLVDRLEAELRVQLLRPVVGERFDEHEVVRRPGLVERVLDDGPAEPAATVRVERVHVLDLSRRTVAPQLAVRRDRAFEPGGEVAGRHRGTDPPFRREQLLGQLGAAVRLSEGDSRVWLGQRVERHLAHAARVDEPVGLADVRHHDVGRLRPAEALQAVGELAAARVRWRSGDARSAPSARRPPRRAPRRSSARRHGGSSRRRRSASTG